MIKHKICSKCGEKKSLKDYYKKDNGRNGYTSVCIACELLTHKQYYQENKEKIKIKAKEYRNTNKKKIAKWQEQYRRDNAELKKERDRQYYEKTKDSQRVQRKEYRENNKDKARERNIIYQEKNREKIKEQRREYYQNNKEKLSETKRVYRQNNKKKRNEREKRKRENDPVYKLRCMLSIKIAKALGRYNLSKTKSCMRYVDYTAQDLYDHLNLQGYDLIKNVSVDHIIPQSLYDFNNEDEISKCWNLRNLRPLDVTKNIQKGAVLDMNLVRIYNIKDLLPIEIINANKCKPTTRVQYIQPVDRCQNERSTDKCKIERHL